MAATVDREMELRHLQMAERHVAVGAQCIARQEQVIQDLARRGHDTAEARELLDSFREMQVLHIHHRDRILEEIKQ